MLFYVYFFAFAYNLSVCELLLLISSKGNWKNSVSNTQIFDQIAKIVPNFKDIKMHESILRIKRIKKWRNYVQRCKETKTWKKIKLTMNEHKNSKSKKSTEKWNWNKK